MKFTDAKYKALVGGNPQGLLLRDSIVEKWNSWNVAASQSRWFYRWRCNHELVAFRVFSETVWGFGMLDWLNTCSPTDLMARFDVLRGYKVNLFDQEAYNSCGLMLPPEITDLDSWLEPLWVRAGGYY